ncbi:Coiled-coil domain-containing protein [Histomonas meleagridis]|uniref:Coiled-coil domain-containing protein 65 n=1 Tax=Histomonas meleagridis TaxID=135588 RepID=UPI00355A7183|nr:Coiled-coil domain-containing protein [Histomonas meleagridis]KAH0800678.1 Coiled-coil domain-containing protein 65 [Histomonas meleagridis]
MDIGKENRVASLKERFEEFKKYEQLSNNAVDSKWREILVAEKNKEQKSSIEKIRADYTKQLDRCDVIINRLFQWLNEGESQYQFALRAHKKNLETLNNLSNKRLQNDFDRFNESLKTIVNEYDSNRKSTLDQYNKNVSEIRDIINAIDHEYTLKKNELESKFRSQKDHLQTNNQEMISTLRTHLTEETNAVSSAITEAYKSYKRLSSGRMEQFNQMLEKHKNRQKIMKSNEDEIIRNASEISHWHRKIKNNERESRESNERLRTEKNNLSLHFRELKEIMAQFRVTEARKLAEISVAFEDINNELTNKLKLAEKILKYAEMARKLETESEQILPFPQTIVDTDPEIKSQMQQFKLQLKGDSKYVAESDLFDNFYRRYNKVLLDKLSLQREKEALTQKNLALKSMLKKYMAGMGISPDLMNKPNTLFIVNQNTNAPLRRVDQEAIPKIDAGLTIGANKLQGF